MNIEAAQDLLKQAEESDNLSVAYFAIDSAKRLDPSIDVEYHKQQALSRWLESEKNRRNELCLHWKQFCGC